MKRVWLLACSAALATAAITITMDDASAARRGGGVRAGGHPGFHGGGLNRPGGINRVGINRPGNVTNWRDRNWNRGWGAAAAGLAVGAATAAAASNYGYYGGYYGTDYAPAYDSGAYYAPTYDGSTYYDQNSPSAYGSCYEQRVSRRTNQLILVRVC